MKYSKANIETIVSTTAATLILPLNNEQTAKRFASMVGKTAVRRRSTSHQSGYTKEAVNLSSNVSDSYERVDLITTELLMEMQPGTQIVLVQNFMNQPVSLEGIRYWDDPRHFRSHPQYQKSRRRSGRLARRCRPWRRSHDADRRHRCRSEYHARRAAYGLSWLGPHVV
jgi:type IV secretory pathway TraG/TraD family ATPase VirD4